MLPLLSTMHGDYLASLVAQTGSLEPACNAGVVSVSHSVVSDSLQPHGLHITSRLLCPWNSPGKHT